MPNRFSLLSQRNFHGKSLQAARMKSAANQQTRRRGTIWQHAALLEIIQNGVWSFRKISGCKLKWKKNKRDVQTSQSWQDLYSSGCHNVKSSGRDKESLWSENSWCQTRQTASRGKKTLRPSKLEPPGESQARKEHFGSFSSCDVKKAVLNCVESQYWRWPLRLRNLQQTNLW